MKIIFMGSPEFSAVVFEKLNGEYPVSAVVTNPDRQSGRGKRTLPSPLKAAAISSGVPVLEFEKVSREGIDEIEALKPELIITAAFGQILSEKFLSIPRFGVLNVHASLLPLYRGASPVQQAILNGDEYTGITIMRTVKEIDAGDILLLKRIKIGNDETAGELFKRLAVLGGEAICEAVKLVDEGKAEYYPQDHSAATRCGMITKADGKINFDKDVKGLDRFVRGMSPNPSAYVFLKGKMLKVFKISSAEDCGEPGTILAADSKRGIIVACADGAVSLDEVMLEGSKRMSGADFMKGHAVEVGYVFE